MRREFRPSGSFPGSLVLTNNMFYIRKRTEPDWEGLRDLEGPGALLNGAQAPGQAALVKIFRNTLGNTQPCSMVPLLFSQGLGPHARDREAERMAHISLSPQPPPELSGHGHEDHSQRNCVMLCPCREGDGDSLAPGNKADGPGAWCDRPF